MWFGYVVTSTQTLATLFELILASRGKFKVISLGKMQFGWTKPTVFALYNRSRSIGFILSILILAEVAGAVRMLRLLHDTDFYGICLLLQVTKDGRIQR